MPIPNHRKNEVAIIGAGIIGLTTAAALIKKGFTVTIYAREISPNTLSNKAAAIWWPYHVGGDKILEWSLYSYQKFAKLCENDQSGVTMVDFTLLHEHRLDNPWWHPAVPEYRTLLGEDIRQITPAYKKYKQATIARVPFIDMSNGKYMQSLMSQENLTIIHQEVSSFDEVFAEDYPLIVNCTGLDAGKLTPDKELYPIRGQVLYVEAPQVDRYLLDEDGPLSLSYVLKRDRDVVLGGTQEYSPGEEVEEEATQEIIRKCQILAPEIGDPQIIDALVGLRPGRKGVRLELEYFSPTQAVLHNYGHGGAGITLSHGSARDAVGLVEQFFAGQTDGFS